MYYVKNERNGKEIYDPRINLAIEYYLLNEVQLDEPILLFYINEPSIIIGRNQNAYEEVNRDYVDEERIHVVRRFSGGGAVYHDYGNLSFCFITKDEGDSFRNFKKFTTPVIEALHSLGVDGAGLKGRNDLLLNGKKFSGNAMYSKNGRLTAHGTIMYDSEITAVVKALKPKKEKLESKGIKSIRSRVTNIKPYMSDEFQNMNTKQFRDRLLLSIFDVDSVENTQQYILSDQEWEKIDDYTKNYFSNWEWNYGKSPKFDIERSQRFSIGTIDIKLNVEKGMIQDIRIFGDFFGLGEISDVEEKFRGIKYEVNTISDVLSTIDIKKYFGDIQKNDLVKLIY